MPQLIYSYLGFSFVLADKQKIDIFTSPSYYHMKRTLLLLLSVIAAAGACAQTITYGIKAGLNYTEFPSTVYFLLPSGALSKVPVNNKYKVGFHVGALVDIAFNSFTIQPGVLFTTKGNKVSFSTTDATGSGSSSDMETTSSTLNYIEVPVNFLYRIKMESGNIFMGAGPYLGIGLSGSGTGYSNYNGTQTKYPISIQFGNGDFKNPDIGVNGLFGYRSNTGIMASIGYGYGITNLRQTGSARNEGFSLSVGYFFR